MILLFQKNKEGLILLLDQLLQSASNFFLAIFLARILGVDEFGVYSIGLFIAHLFLSILTAAITTLMLKNSFHKGRYDFGYLRIVYRKLAIFLSFVLLVCVSYIYLFQSGYLEIDFVYFVTLFLLYDFSRKRLISEGSNVFLLFQSVMYSILVYVVLVLFVDAESGVDFQVLSILYTPALFIIGLDVIRLFKSAGYEYRRKLNEYDIARDLLLIGVVQWGNQKVIQLALGFWHGAGMVGGLNAYYSIVGVVNPFFLFLDNYFIKKTSAVYADHGIHEVDRYLKSTFKYFYIIFFMTLFALSVFSGEVVSFVLGGEYVEYSYCIIFISISYMFLLIYKKYYYLLLVASAQEGLRRFQIGMAIYGVPIALLTVYFYSLMAVLFFIVISSALAALNSYVVCKRVLKNA